MSLPPLVLVVLLGDLMLWAAFRRLAADADGSSARRLGLSLWSQSFAFGAGRYAFALAEVLRPDVAWLLRVGMLILATGSAAMMVDGTLLFVGRHRSWLARGFALTIVVWIGVATALALPPLVLMLPVFGFLGGAMIAAGIAVLRVGSAAEDRLAGVLLIVWGLHRLDYPFLRDVEGFAPWGFALAAICELGVGLSFVMAALAAAVRDRDAAAQTYRDFYARSPVGYFRCTPTGQILEANPALTGMLGWPEGLYGNEAAVVGLDLQQLALRSDDRLAMFTTPDDTVKAQVLAWRRRTGEPVFVVLTSHRLRDDGGNIIGYEGFTRDVTPETRLDRALQHAQRLDLIGRMAGGIAHDFNNLLTVIMGNTDLLRHRLPDGPARALADEIASASDSAARLTRQMLTLSRPSPTIGAKVDLVTFVTEAAPVLRRLVAPRTLDVTAQGEAVVVGTPSQLDQILINLVTNARDATALDGVITVHVTCGTVAHQITVTDTGTGISPQVLPNIFEPFFTTKGGEGTGLGLAVLHRIVVAMGGDAVVSQTGPGGTTFSVSLPVASQAAPSKVPVGSARVLVVDDESAVTRFLERGLTERGFAVTVCHSAEAAMEAVATQPSAFDVVVSDITMPGMSGVALAEALQASNPRLPVVLMTGYTQATVADLRPYRVVEKPFSVDALILAMGMAAPVLEVDEHAAHQAVASGNDA